MAPITAPQVIAAWALGAASRRDAIIATANRRNPFDAISKSPAVFTFSRYVLLPAGEAPALM